MFSLLNGRLMTMNLDAFPLLSRSTRFAPTTSFIPKPSFVKPVTVVADKPIISKEAWMHAFDCIKSGEQSFDDTYFWGFKAPMFMNAYEHAFRLRYKKNTVKTIRDMGDLTKTVTKKTPVQQIQTTLYESESDDQDYDYEQENIVWVQTKKTPSESLAEIGIKEQHIVPILEYMKKVCFTH